MRRIVHLALFGLAAATMACEPEQVIETQAIPSAGVRFINAVPDTGAMDMRFVDIVESNAHFVIPFRNNVVTTAGVPASTQIQFKAARAGQRHFRIFMNGSTAAVASTVVKDTTVTLEAGKLYTALLWGYSRPGATPAMKLTFFEETVPDPGANVALRVINAAPTPVDVRHYVSTGTVPAAATWGNVPGMSISSYITAPPSQYRFNVRHTATGNAVVTDPLALIGTEKTVDMEALPGTTVAGSAISMIIFPGSTVGSKAPQTAPFVFTTGTTSLSATATGYARAAGSFITDGFLVGTPITVTGFGTVGNNGTATVTAVTATALTVDRVLIPEAAAAGRLIVGPQTGRPAVSFMWDRRPPR